MLMLMMTAVAGGFGGAARFLLDTTIARHNRATVPMGTVIVNVSACLLLGLLTGYVLAHAGAEDVRTVLGVGFLGGYSTFSTAAVEGARLLRERRYAAAVLHGGGMLVASLVASAGGLLLGGLVP